MYNSKTVKKFIDAIDVNKENWENMQLTNCYAYALGIDLDIGREILLLGEISGMNYGIRNAFDLKTALLFDAIRLDLEISEVDPAIKIPDEDSWLIAMFMTPFYVDEKFEKSYDYHFLRKTKYQNWTHKIGNSNNITNMDEDDKKINNPKYANIMLDSNIPYNYIGSYLLTKKKKQIKVL